MVERTPRVLNQWAKSDEGKPAPFHAPPSTLGSQHSSPFIITLLPTDPQDTRFPHYYLNGKSTACIFFVRIISGILNCFFLGMCVIVVKNIAKRHFFMYSCALLYLPDGFDYYRLIVKLNIYIQPSIILTKFENYLIFFHSNYN